MLGLEGRERRVYVPSFADPVAEEKRASIKCKGSRLGIAATATMFVVVEGEGVMEGFSAGASDPYFNRGNEGIPEKEVMIVAKSVDSIQGDVHLSMKMPTLLRNSPRENEARSVERINRAGVMID